MHVRFREGRWGVGREGDAMEWLRCVSCVAVYCFLEQEKWAYVTVM